MSQESLREVGLVVPATYSAFTKYKKTAEILGKEIFSHYNLTFKRNEKVALYPVYVSESKKYNI